jgi:putative component of toxin-antitoxin plasmid stabilization module
VAEVRQTDVFVAWFEGLKDRAARARITARKPVGKASQKCESTTVRATGCISSSAAMRLSFCFDGGEKRDQSRDIARALELAKEV